jgi:hypothetical protein
MSAPVDLNAQVQQVFDDLHTTIVKYSTVADTLLALINDMDALVKDVHLHWPLAKPEVT